MLRYQPVLTLFLTMVLAQETKMVTGTATYRERIALPPDAVLEMTLEDVSKADSPAVVIGRSRIEKPGQPPFRFSIGYDPARIAENHKYAVRARIMVDGKPMFVTDRWYPVLTQRHGNQAPMIILRRASASPGGQTAGKPAEERTVKRGMFSYMADAASFTDCESGKRWPVAMEGAYKEVEVAYLKLRRKPGEEVLLEIEGRLAMRPHREEGHPPVLNLIIDRHIGFFPGKTCGARQSKARLHGTDWKLTRLGDKPVIRTEKQREPSLVFQEGRVSGFGGCNNLTGSYKLSGNQLSFSPLGATQMACLEGEDIERAFFKALEQVHSWKISGEHLELYDASGNMLTRFEAKPLR